MNRIELYKYKLLEDIFFLSKLGVVLTKGRVFHWFILEKYIICLFWFAFK